MVAETGVDSFDQPGTMAGMSSYPFKCDLCGGVTDAPTYGDLNCQHCGQAFVYDECHQIKLSERQLQTLRDSRWIPVSERLPEPGESLLIAFRVDADGKPPLAGCNGKGWLITVASLDRIGGQYLWTSEYGDESPSHWMPLPEPPEVE